VIPEAPSFDAIVVGSGISGGWAAKELCEKGLKTLVLERGRNVVHIKDYPTMNLNPWELPHRGAMSRQQLKENPLISKAAGYGEDTAHFFVKDRDHPYVQEKPFDWIRGYQVGGKSIIWGRACQRWSKYEFTAPERQGYGMNWPIGYDDVAPWYSHVERFIGVCGNADGLEAMPDGEYLPPFDFNCVEKHLSDKVHAHYGNRHVVQGRWAHLSQPKAIHLEQGRGTCQARNLCMRGCPYGGYFGKIDGFEDKYFYIRNPTECILVNFRNLGKQEMDFVGGYTTFTGAYRERGEPTTERVGSEYKDAQAKPGPWGIYMYMQGETIPKESNQVTLHGKQNL